MSIFRQFLTFSSFTFISRILGLGREMLISYIFGVSFLSDILIIAIRFPNFFRKFFAEGALHASLVPELSSSKSHKDARDIACGVFSIMFYLLLIFILCIEILLPFLIYILAPGFVEVHYKIVLNTLRITTPYILFVSMSGVLTAILNSLKKFSAESSIQIVLNIVMILGLLICNQSLYVLTSFFLLGGILQLLYAYKLCIWNGFNIRIMKPNFNPYIKKIFKRMLESSLSAGVIQINLFFDLCLASFLPKGSLTYLFFADRINQFPLSIIGISLGAVFLSNFSEVAHDKYRLNDYLRNSILMVLQIGLPAAAGVFIFSDIIVCILFGRGEFSLLHCVQTSKALQAYAIGLPAYIMSKIFASYFFAQKKNRVALYISIIMVFFNIIGNVLLMFKFGHVGMALSTAISAWIGLIFYWFIISKNIATIDFLNHVIRIFIWFFLHFYLILIAKKQLSLGVHAPYLYNIFGFLTIGITACASYMGFGYALGFMRIKFKKSFVD